MVQPYIENYVPGELVRAYHRNTGPLRKIEKEQDMIDTLPTCEVPAISPYFYDTNKLVAQILTPQETTQSQQELFAEAIDSGGHTIDLIHECVKELQEVHSVPRLIMLSQLRYLALGELTLQLKYYYRGVHVPFVAAGRGCEFDVRVYGSR